MSAFRCATLSVPVSYADPHGAQVPISVVELVATGPHPIGDIVLNPGGPGGSGVQFLEGAGHSFPAALRARFTLVSFDPRGVGSSEPLWCLTGSELEANTALNPSPQTPTQIAALVSSAKAFVHGCEQSASNTFLANMSTANTARDMDRVRAALGQKRLTYLGFSYGTYLGALYAEMFPKHIRAMVLDGAVDPSLDFETAGAEQAAGFETDLHKFFGRCGRHSRCSANSVTPRAKAYATVISGLKDGHTMPSELAEPLGETTVDYGVAVRGVLTGLYSTSSWPDLSKALVSAEHDDGSRLAAFAYVGAGLGPDLKFSNLVSANMATGCVDGYGPKTLRGYEELARRLSASAPDFGGLEAWSGLPCLYWPIRTRANLAPVDAPGAPPILVVGSTADPATPYAWAQALANELPRATLLTRRGAGHTAYLSSSCIQEWVDRYLETLRMPSAGVVCSSD